MSVKERKRTLSKNRFLLLTLLAVIGLSFGGIWIFNLSTGDKPYSVPWEPKRPKAEIEDACRQLVSEARQKAFQAIYQRSSEFSEFIHSRMSGVKPFSKDVVSLYGKWRAIAPYLPFTDKEGHKKYVQEKFEKYIFTTAELASAVRIAVEGSVKDLESIENELAVALRQEILGHSLAPDEIPIAAEEFKNAIERLVAASQWDAAKTAGGLVVSEVTSQVAAQVLLRLGVSTGILTAGAANSWWSFGAAAVVGILVDVAWELIDDPAGDIEREMVSALDWISINGSYAIRDEMAKTIAKRCELWNKTVEEIVP